MAWVACTCPLPTGYGVWLWGCAPSPKHFSIFELKNVFWYILGLIKKLLLIGLASQFFGQHPFSGRKIAPLFPMPTLL